MPITIAQLNTLAEKYGFDMNDARATIGLPTSSRGGPAAGEAKKANKVKCMDGKCAVLPKTTTSKKRGPSGYNLYMSDVRERVVRDLEGKLKSGEKMPKGAVMSEIGKRWRNLPDSSREHWNAKAAKAAV